jgi:hypothetical protein
MLQNHNPEQLPLIRMLEIVRDRVESIHASQYAITEELRTSRPTCPYSASLSRKAQALHGHFNWRVDLYSNSSDRLGLRG